MAERPRQMGEGRRLLRDIALAAGLACVTALAAYLLGFREPSFLLIGAVIGLGLFVLLQWGDKLIARTGYLDIPITVSFRWPHWHPPRWAGKGRLRRETFALVQDINEYIKSQPTIADEMPQRFEKSARLRAITDSQERMALSTQLMIEESKEYERKRQDLSAKFGGRIGALVSHYKRRGMLDERGAVDILWHCHSIYGLGDGAAKLEALARQI